MTFKSFTAIAPAPVSRTMLQFADNLALARRRRRISQASMAERLGVSVASVRRLERGDPAVAWGTVVRALHVLGGLERFASLLDAASDDIGLILQDKSLPKRIRRRKSGLEAGAL